MKQKQTTRSVNVKIILASAFALALALMIVPTRATALVTCPTLSTADSDGDGFNDALECAGITLSAGNAFGGATFVPTCTVGIARSLCVDPNSKDAFVIVTRATPSLIPSDPFRYIEASTAAGGLGLAVHEITTTRTDRKVSDASPQLAARLRESLSPATSTDNILGSANLGITLDLATVYTQRIVSFVNSVCVGGTTCVDSISLTNGVDTPSEVIDQYIRHTITHELGGHVLTLAPVYNARYGGNHYQAGTKVVMEQNVTYTKKGTKVTWYLSTAYTDPDRAGVRLQ